MPPKHNPPPYPASGPWRRNKDEIRYKDKFGEKEIPVSDADDLRIDGLPVNDFIQKYRDDSEVANSADELDRLDGDRAKLAGQYPELTKERMASSSYWRSLRDALAAAYRNSGDTKMADTFHKGVEKSYVLAQLETSDPNDPSSVKAIKRYGNDLTNNRSDRNAKSGQAEKVAEAVARLYIKRLDPAAEPKVLRRVKEKPGAGTIDIVAVVHGKLILIEAKTGESKLGPAIVENDIGEYDDAFQGTRIYLRAKLREDMELRDWLESNYPNIFADLHGAGAEVGYYHLHTPLVDKKDKHGNIVTDGYGNPVKIIGTSTIKQFDVGPDPDPDSDFDIVNLTNPPDPQKYKKPSRKRYEKNLRRLGLLTLAGFGGGTAVLAAGAIITPAPAGAGAIPMEQVGQLPVRTDNGDSASEGSSSSEDGILSSLTEAVAELGRLLSSFKDQVQNGLNSLSIMVGEAASNMIGFVSGIVDSAGAQTLIEEASQLWAEGQELINYAMLLSPVGTVTAAISAAITIIQQLVTHWDEIRAGFDWALKQVLEPVAEFFKAAFKVYITPYKVVFDLVMSGFNGMSGVVAGVVSTVGSVVMGIVRTIGEFLQKIDFEVAGKHFGLKSVGDAMVSWATGRMADGGLVRAPEAARMPGAAGMRRSSGIHVMAVIDHSVLRAAQAEERKIGYAYRSPLLHDGAFVRRDSGPGARTIEVRVPNVESAFAEIKAFQARYDMRFESVGV